MADADAAVVRQVVALAFLLVLTAVSGVRSRHELAVALVVLAGTIIVGAGAEYWCWWGPRRAGSRRA